MIVVDVGNVFFTASWVENRYRVLTCQVTYSDSQQFEVARRDGMIWIDARLYAPTDVGHTIFKTKVEAEAYCRSRQEINDSWEHISRLRGWRSDR